MTNNDMDRVVPLGQLDDFKVAEGDPDVRGWEVLASDGRKIGEVDELLVDTNAMKVRYLDVDVDDGVIGDDRHVLIPIGYARLEQERDCVFVDTLASADLQGLPSYDQGPLTRDFESSVRDSFSRHSARPSMGMAGAGMMDTAGLDNTPGTGTGLGMTGTTTGTGLSGAGTGMRAETAAMGESVPPGEGMRNAGYDLDRGTTSPLSGSDRRDTGSMHTGMSGGGLSAGAMDTGTTGGGLSADSTSPGLGGTARGDVSHRASSGTAGSDYLHNADEDFYASDAFDDSRFYGSRRGGTGEDPRNRGTGGSGSL